MKLLLAGAAALALMAGIRFGVQGAPDAVDPVTTASVGDEATDPSAPRRYTLFVAGKAAGCVLIKGRTGADGTAALQAAVCEALPRIAEAREWREGEGGTLALAAADGRPLLELTPGDGVAYETYRPGSPLVSIVAN